MPYLTKGHSKEQSTRLGFKVDHGQIRFKYIKIKM